MSSAPPCILFPHLEAPRISPISFGLRYMFVQQTNNRTGARARKAIKLPLRILAHHLDLSHRNVQCHPSAGGSWLPSARQRYEQPCEPHAASAVSCIHFCRDTTNQSTQFKIEICLESSPLRNKSVYLSHYIQQHATTPTTMGGQVHPRHAGNISERPKPFESTAASTYSMERRL